MQFSNNCVRFLFQVCMVSIVALLAPAHSFAFTGDVVSRAIQAFFPGVPEMVAIARCESGLRQYGDDGTVLRGGVGGHMIGLYQLHETYHRRAAQAKGFDIDTLLGNLAYTRTLYEEEGLTPWESSRTCWETVDPAQKTLAMSSPSTSATLKSTLRFGAQGDEVATVQTRLRVTGYLGADATPNVFDMPTFRALIAFQCDRHIACLSGGPYTGLGVTDERTRNALMQKNTVAER